MDSSGHRISPGDISLPLVIEETETGIKITRGTLEENALRTEVNSNDNVEDDFDCGHNVTSDVKEERTGKRGKGKIVDQTHLIVEGKRRHQPGKQSVCNKNKLKEK